MAFKGTAGKSSSGASMSKYDVEVEARLKKLEAAVKELQNHSHDAPGVDAGELQGLKKAIFDNAVSPDRLDKIERQLANLIAVVENELHPGVDWDE